MRSRGTMLLLSLLVLGIYVLPSVTARYAGSHTMEVNTSVGGPQNMKCGQCHGYIVDELNATTKSDYVVYQHMVAAGASTADTVCQFCHTVSTGIVGSHTQVTIKPCTDSSCHGNESSSEITRNVTGRLNTSVDMHRGWYRAMEATNDPLGRVDSSGTALKAGYYVCLGCHTHVGVAFNVTRPNSVNVTMDIDDDSAAWVNVTGLVVDTSSTTTNTSDANPGTKWA